MSFRLDNRMLSAADRLVAGMGFSSNRWQVVGTIAAADRPQPIAWLARDTGVNRQNIQRIANDLARARLVASQPNPHHRRARLGVPTERGKHTFDAAMPTGPVDQQTLERASGRRHRDDT